MNLLWIDLETGGLDPETSDIVEICFQETDREGNPGTSLGARIHPELPVHPRAAAVNGYTPQRWSEEGAWTKKFAVAAANLMFADREFIPAGWNVGFDLRFLKKHMPGLRMKIHPDETSSHHPFDLMAYGWDKIADIEKPHLEHLCRRLGVEVRDQHTAWGDVALMIECYRRLRGLRS